jgi:hypothetical protein
MSSIQERMGRDATKYVYGRAWIIHNRVSINGRFWSPDTLCDYSTPSNNRVEVGRIRDFVVVEYTHKEYERKKGKVRASNLKGMLSFVRARQFHPTPARVSNMWVAPAKPRYRLQRRAISIKDLGAFLHRAPDRNGEPGIVNLIKVGSAFA